MPVEKHDWENVIGTLECGCLVVGNGEKGAPYDLKPCDFHSLDDGDILDHYSASPRKEFEEYALTLERSVVSLGLRNMLLKHRLDKKEEK